MTAPLHHVNQLYLHLPAMGGFVAGQAAAGEELQRQARLAEAQALYRDAVEIVAAAKDTVAIEPIRPEPEPGRWGRRRQKRRGATEAQDEPEMAGTGAFEFVVEPVVDARV